jgi:hypothetical protein
VSAPHPCAPFMNLKLPVSDVALLLGRIRLNRFPSGPLAADSESRRNTQTTARALNRYGLLKRSLREEVGTSTPSTDQLSVVTSS